MRYLSLLGVSLLLAWPFRQIYAASPSVLFSEVQTGMPGAAGQEFIELYNPTAADVTLEGWSVQYKSASSENLPTSWTKRALLTGTIKSHGFYLLAPKAYLPAADVELSTGLAAAGGHIRLIDNSNTLIDLVGWGSGNSPEVATASAPMPGQSLERLVGGRDESGGNGIDTDNNDADFDIREIPQPQSSTSPTEEPRELAEIQTNPPPIITALADNSSKSEPEITELLVDPESPQSDANDEFIELYNPGDAALRLSGYRLQTGKSFHDSYTLPELTLPAGEYALIYSRDSKLALTNSGGAARLLDPAGQVVSLVPEYDEAEAGEAWASFNDGWVWTQEPTPGRANSMLAPSPSHKTAKTAKAKVATTKAAKQPTGGKSSTVKTLSAKDPTGNQVEAQPTIKPPAKWLLIAAIALTMGYALYEFRYDLQNYYYLARRKLSPRRKNRPTA